MRAALPGHPLPDVRIELYDGSYHEVDSSAAAFRIAGSIAFQDASTKARPVLLEPVMRVEVTVPEEYLGPVTADMNARRAEITQVLARGKLRVIEALVPLAKMFDYSDKVRSISQGRASFTMEPHAYEPAPDEVLHALLHPEDTF